MAQRSKQVMPERFGDVLLGLGHGCLLVDYAGRVRFANAQAARLTQYSLDELYECAMPDLLLDPDLLLRRQMGMMLLRGDRVEQLHTWRLKDGSHVSMSMTLLPAELEGEAHALVLFCQDADATSSPHRDVTVSLLEDMTLTSAMLVTDPSPSQLLGRIVDQLSHLTDASIVAIYVYDPTDDMLVLEAATGLPHDVSGTRVPSDSGIVGQCFQHGETINLAQMSDSPHLADLGATYSLAAGQYAHKPGLGVPLIHAHETLGVLTMIEPRSGRQFGATDEQIARLFAHQVSMALAQARLYREAQLSSEALRRANTALRQLDRMKDDFMTMVSHELQQPLATARLGVDLVLHDRAELSERHSQLLERSLKNLDALGQILRDMLLLTDLHRADDAHRAVVDLADAASSVYAGMAARAQSKGLCIELRMPSEPALVDVPPRALSRIIEHLLDNAIKFTSRGRIEVQVRAQGGRAMLEVTDTGIGISSEQERRIFEAFYQADGSNRRAYDGLGLGLAVVRQVAEIYGGRVSVQSDQGKGSRFTVSFALVADV